MSHQIFFRLWMTDIRCNSTIPMFQTIVSISWDIGKQSAYLFLFTFTRPQSPSKRNWNCQWIRRSIFTFFPRFLSRPIASCPALIFLSHLISYVFFSYIIVVFMTVAPFLILVQTLLFIPDTLFIASSFPFFVHIFPFSGNSSITPSVGVCTSQCGYPVFFSWYATIRWSLRRRPSWRTRFRCRRLVIKRWVKRERRSWLWFSIFQKTATFHRLQAKEILPIRYRSARFERLRGESWYRGCRNIDFFQPPQKTWSQFSWNQRSSKRNNQTSPALSQPRSKWFRLQRLSLKFH